MPFIKSSGKWLKEARFNTGTSLMVKIAGDYIVLMPDSSQEQALRKQLAQVKNTLNRVKQDILS